MKIVIVGGGAGGLELAVSLARKKADVVLVDKEKTHLWKPHLHEVAAGTMNSHYEQVDYLSLANKFKFRFVWAEFLGVDGRTIKLKERTNNVGEVVVPAQTISYDKLVLAIGSTSNSFNTPGVEHAFSLDDLKSANKFQETLLEHAIKKEYEKKSFTITIVGGGATGVELAAELYQTTKKLSHFGMEHLQKNPLTIHIINAAPNLLPGMASKISDGAAEILKDLAVEVHNSTKVVAVEKSQLTVESAGIRRTIDTDMIVWAAGVKSSDLLKNLGLTTTPNNQIVVNTHLQSSNTDIYAIGDCASAVWHNAPKTGMSVPPRAQSAHQMSDYLSKYLLSDVRPDFCYRDFGSLISLGDSDSVGTLMGFLSSKSLFVEGRIAKFMYLSLYHGHQVKIHGFTAAMGLLAGKLIQKRFTPKVKLH